MASHILHRQIRAQYPVVAGGKGVYLTDSQGRDYLDASGGAAVSCLGHGHPRVLAAIKAQLDRAAFAHSAYFTNEPAENLADFLVERAPGDLGRVAFFSGGSEAVEAAIKLARQYHVERDDMSRKHFIARRQSYHGTTLGALALGHHKTRRAPFAPMIEQMTKSHIAPCYAYRNQELGETEDAYGLRAAQKLEEEIQRLGPENIAAFVAETIVGATAGVVPAAKGYFKEIRRICDTHGIVMILDEVMCGSGRSGSLFAFEQEGIVPDIVTMAKGLGGGYQPVGALMVSNKIADTLEGGSGAFQHGHTYMGHATACAGALEVQRVVEDEGLLEQVHEKGSIMMALLRDKLGQHAHVGDIRGRGLFIGVELVADRESKQPFPRPRKVAEQIKRHAMNNGLICYPGGGTADGDVGDHILLAPPFIISQEEMAEAVDRLARSVDQALMSVEEKFGPYTLPEGLA